MTHLFWTVGSARTAAKTRRAIRRPDRHAPHPRGGANVASAHQSRAAVSGGTGVSPLRRKRSPWRDVESVRPCTQSRRPFSR